MKIKILESLAGKDFSYGSDEVADVPEFSDEWALYHAPISVEYPASWTSVLPISPTVFVITSISIIIGTTYWVFKNPRLYNINNPYVIKININNLIK